MYDWGIYDRALTPSEIQTLANDHVADLRQAPQQVTITGESQRKTGTLQVSRDVSNPSYSQGFARSASEAAEPGLRKGQVLRYSPTLGVTGDTIRDVSGRGNNGTNNGATWVVSGGKPALEFVEASTTYVNIPDAPSLNFSNAMTIAVWFRLDHLGEQMFLASKGTGFTGSSDDWWLQVVANRVEFSIFRPAGAGRVGVLATEAIADLDWHLACGVFDGNAVRVFVDGKPLGAISSYSGAIQNAGAAMRLGALGNFFLYDGWLSDTYLYNRALNQSEITHLYRDHVADLRLREMVIPTSGIARPLINGGLVDGPTIGSLVG